MAEVVCERTIVAGFGHALDGVLVAVGRSEINGAVHCARSTTSQEVDKEDSFVGNGRACEVATMGGRERHCRMRCEGGSMDRVGSRDYSGEREQRMWVERTR